MHEVSLAEDVLETVIAVSRREKAGSVRGVRLRVGALSGVDLNALAFALEAIAPGTLLDGCEIELFEISGSAYCRACQRREAITFRLSPCPVCGLQALTDHEGTDLVIESIITDT